MFRAFLGFLCFLHTHLFLQPMYLINDLNILLGQFLRPNKVCDCDSLLVHRVEVLDVVVKEVIRAVASVSSFYKWINVLQ